MAEEIELPVQDTPTPYVDKVYTALKDNLKGFNKTPEQFKTSMQDSAYASKAYLALKDNLTGFNKTQGDFYKEVGVPKKPSPSGGQNTLPSFQNGSDPFQVSQPNIEPTPVLPQYRNEVMSQARAMGEKNNTHRQQNPTAQQPKKDRSFIEDIAQGAYLPAFNQGFNDLVVKPAAGATDLIDRTVDKLYTNLTGEQTPEWLRKKGAFDKVASYYDKAYETRDKPTSIVGEIREGVMGTLPLMAAMATGQGEVNLFSKTPQLISNLTKTFATTHGLTAFKEATDEGKGYVESLDKGAEGAIKGGVEGLKLEAEMMLGGAMGKGVVNKLAKKALLKGGKAAEAVLHALGVGTVFGGTSAGEDLLAGRDINTREAMKQFGMGLAFELPGVAKGINAEVRDAGESRKINKDALQVATVSDAASNLHSESVIRTLTETPPEQLLDIKDNIKDGHEDLYANSIEKGAAAYEAKDTNEKKQLYADQLVLKTQGDVKYMSDLLQKGNRDEIVSVIESSDEITPEQKADLFQKIEILSTKDPIKSNEETVNTTEAPEQQSVNETVASEEIAQPVAKTKVNEAPVEVPPVKAEVLPNEGQKVSETVDENGTQDKITISEVADKPVIYKGEPAEIIQDGQTLVAKIKGSNREYELGNVEDIGDRSIKELGIEHETSVVNTDTDGNLVVRGKKLINNYSDPKSAINYDKAGDIVSVNLETEDGAKRTFKGDVAEDLAYQIHLKELNKNNETREQFEQFVEQHEPSKTAIVDAENAIAAEKGTVENNATVSRKPATARATKVKPVAEPVAKAEPVKKEIRPEKPETTAEKKSPEKPSQEAVRPSQGDAGSSTKAGDPLRSFADKLRSGKINKLGGFRASTGLDAVWDGSLEVVATSLEGGAKIADAIEAGLKHIRDSDWYKNLTEKDRFEKEYAEHLNSEFSATEKEATQEPKDEVSKDLKDLAIDIPNNGEVKKYLSGETIEKHEGDDLRNDQSYIQQELNPALEHGVRIIEQAKAEFGKDYVPKTLKFIEGNGTVEGKALMYVSLENDLAARKLAEPENDLAISKLQDLVRAKSQAYLRSNALAINMGRLRKFAEVGYDINRVTDNFFSNKELERKAKVEKAIQSSPDEINKAAERAEAEVKDEGDFDIKPKPRKKKFGLNESQKKERDKLAKEFRSQLNDVTRIATLLVDKKFLRYAKLEFLDTAGDFESFAYKMIDNVGEGIKEHLPELYKKLGGEDEVKLKKKRGSEKTAEERLGDAKELVQKRIDNIFEEIQNKKRELKERGATIDADPELKALQAEEAALRRVRDKELPLDRKPVTDAQKARTQVAKLINEIEDIDKQIRQGEKDAIAEKRDPVVDEKVNKLKAEKSARLEVLNAIDPSPKETIKRALIENGFGREITVNTKNGKEPRTIIDWKKLAGDEGSVSNIQAHVEEYLRNNGYGTGEILRMQDAFVKEYNDLRASVIEKSLSELERRNTETSPPDIKTTAKRLSELYNYGLFDKQVDSYDYLMNKALGLSPLAQESFFKAKVLAKSLSDLFKSKGDNGKVINQSNLKHAENVINKQIEDLLSDVAFKQSNWAYKAATVTKEYVGMAQRSMLVTLSQLLENTSSGYIARAFNKIGYSIDNVDTKSMTSLRTKLAANIYKDINLNAALDYGDVNSPFLNKSRTMELINKASDNKIYHTVTSAYLGRSFLEAADSMHKLALTEKFFAYNLIKVLRKKGMAKEEAINYVSEQLTGQSFEDALVTSKTIIEKINTDAGKEVIPNNKKSIYRFANDIVREALIGGNKLNLKEVEASFGAAYTAAGYELGHEANNLTSMMVSGLSSKIQAKLNKAVKEKNWASATAYTGASIISTNVMNPFVGGGSNWVFLGLQKSGVPTLSTLYWNMASRRGIDVSSEAGLKTLEKDLTSQMLAKNANIRLVIGATVSLAAVALAKSTGVDDDLDKWLRKNKWAKKYFYKVSPPAISLMLAMKDKEVGHFVAGMLNVKDNQAFDEGKKFVTAVDNSFKNSNKAHKKAAGAAGDLIGSRLSTPIVPWRLVRDIQDINRGLEGLPPIKKDYQTSGFMNGYFKGGLAEYLGLRPKKQ